MHTCLDWLADRRASTYYRGQWHGPNDTVNAAPGMTNRRLVRPVRSSARTVKTGTGAVTAARQIGRAWPRRWPPHLHPRHPRCWPRPCARADAVRSGWRTRKAAGASACIRAAAFSNRGGTRPPVHSSGKHGRRVTGRRSSDARILALVPTKLTPGPGTNMVVEDHVVWRPLLLRQSCVRIAH